MNYELVEVNASDTRNEEAIKNIVGMASKQKSFFYQGKVIMIDEVDGLSGQDDRGGVSALLEVISQSQYPIVCIATDPFEQKLSKLRTKSAMLQFEEIPAAAIYDRLKKICELEKIKCSDEALKSLSRRAGGDLRAAINDLESMSMFGEFQKDDLETMSEREREESINNALLKVFKSTDPNIAIESMDKVDEDPEKKLLWIDESLPLEYTNPEDLDRAYHYLSQSDVFLRRIRRWQHWRFLLYVSNFLSGGVAVSKTQKNPQMIEYKQTSRILKIWMANQKYMKRKAIAEKIAEKMHTSTKDALKNILPYIKPLFKTDKGKAVADELELSDEEVEWLCK